MKYINLSYTYTAIGMLPSYKTMFLLENVFRISWQTFLVGWLNSYLQALSLFLLSIIESEKKTKYFLSLPWS